MENPQTPICSVDDDVDWRTYLANSSRPLLPCEVTPFELRSTLPKDWIAKELTRSYRIGFESVSSAFTISGLATRSQALRGEASKLKHNSIRRALMIGLQMSNHSSVASH